ncbi:hypothetical protein D9M72_461570 [compost metagenome]
MRAVRLKVQHAGTLCRHPDGNGEARTPAADSPTSRGVSGGTRKDVGQGAVLRHGRPGTRTGLKPRRHASAISVEEYFRDEIGDEVRRGVRNAHPGGGATQFDETARCGGTDLCTVKNLPASADRGGRYAWKSGGAAGATGQY